MTTPAQAPAACKNRRAIIAGMEVATAQPMVAAR